MLETILLVFIVSFLFNLWWSCRRPNNYPPGPPALPFFGNVFQIPQPPRHVYQAVEEWSEKFGPIIGLVLGRTKMVMVAGADNVLAALRKDEFQSRPDAYTIRQRSFGKCLGIFLSNGEEWASSRKFVVKQMRAYGKNEKENVILEEISLLMDTFKDGSTIQGTGIFGVAAVNVIWSIIANKRIDINDPKSREFMRDLNEMMRKGNPAFGGSLVDISPIFRFVDSTFKWNLKITRGIQEYIRRAIKEHEEILDPNNPLDLIDHYLIKMKEGNNSLFIEEDLIMVGMDLFVAGAESVSNSVEYVLLYMALYPDIQQKMQAEIDEVLGRGRKPNLEDKTNLHYTMAVLTEVERVNSVVPTNVPHTCTMDTTFEGYFIPKGTIISMNLRSLGHDTKYWKDPDHFDPQRHLTEGKFVKPSLLATFGAGHRACVGEMIARNTMFLFTVTFFEKFAISLPPGEELPSTLSLPGFTAAPQPFRVMIHSRY